MNTGDPAVLTSNETGDSPSIASFRYNTRSKKSSKKITSTPGKSGKNLMPSDTISIYPSSHPIPGSSSNAMSCQPSCSDHINAASKSMHSTGVLQHSDVITPESCIFEDTSKAVTAVETQQSKPKTHRRTSQRRNRKDRRPGLGDQPTEILREIFSQCDAVSLARLCKTCCRFHDVICKDEVLWRKSGLDVPVCNLQNENVVQRTQTILSMQDRCRVSHNWTIGKYYEEVYQLSTKYTKTKFMPWILLEKDKLWISKGNRLQVHIRKGKQLVKSSKIFFQPAYEDIGRFVYQKGVIVGGGRDGGLYGWDWGNSLLQFCKSRSHCSDIHAIDMSHPLVLTASRDGYVKIWTLKDLYRISRGDTMPIASVFLGDRVWCLRVSPDADKWCAGTSALHQMPPLHVFDLTSGLRCMTLGLNEAPRKGAGVLDVLWETPSTVLSCGYDTFVKLWDIRTGNCEMRWEDPFDSAQYCLATDHLNSVLSGTGHHGRVQLWDKRRSKGVQMYFATTNHNTPVYTIAFDPVQLFVGLDQSLNVLDFSRYVAPIHNYAAQI